MGALYENGVAQLLSPLIANSSTRLNSDQQHRIGVWVLRTMLPLRIAEGVKARTDYEVDRSLLMKMNANNSPPDGLSVRVARYPATDDDPEGETANLDQLLRGGPPAKISSLGLSSLGYVAFEVNVGEPERLSISSRGQQSATSSFVFGRQASSTSTFPQLKS